VVVENQTEHQPIKMYWTHYTIWATHTPH